MNTSDSEIRQRLRLGEDSAWEFKRFEFHRNRPTSPRRDDLADEMAAFANANGGVLLCGVTDDGRIQGMSQSQMAAVDRLLVEVGTDSVEPPSAYQCSPSRAGGKGVSVRRSPAGRSRSRAGRKCVHPCRFDQASSGWCRTPSAGAEPHVEPLPVV